MDKSLLAAIIITSVFFSSSVWVGFHNARLAAEQPARPAPTQEPAVPPTREKVLGKKEKGCATIQDGAIKSSDGEIVTTGFDEWGYNYQAHIFNGMYCDAYRDAGWCQGWKDVNLLMKWNDLWLSNKDCDGDHFLDRYPGHSSYIGSGAWVTNHQSGEYIGEDNQSHRWTYFVKIVAKPTASYDCAATGSQEIWGSFCTVQSVYNDPYGGYHGLEFKAARPGLGNW